MTHKVWNKKKAIKIAKCEGIEITKIHWIIILYFRDFYYLHKSIPNNRELLFFLNKKLKIKVDNILLYNLFPKGLIKQVSKIACLPDFVRCF